MTQLKCLTPLGLTTYRERQFYYDETVTEYFLKTNIVTVQSHEFAHNWFGNLVTPRWWSFLWLKEGFANLFQHVGTDMVSGLILFYLTNLRSQNYWYLKTIKYKLLISCC